MLVAYLLYTVLMYFDNSVEKWANFVQRSIIKKIYPSSGELSIVAPGVQAIQVDSSPSHLSENGILVIFLCNKMFTVFLITHVRLSVCL